MIHGVDHPPLRRWCRTLFDVLTSVALLTHATEARAADPATVVPADVATVSLRVREVGTGRPVGILVRIGDVEVRTDVRGRATIAVAPGIYPVVIEAEDGPRPHGVVEVIPGSDARLDLFVVPPEIVEVEAPGRPRAADERVTPQETLRLVPGAFGDPVRALEVDPAISQLRVGDPGLTVRGAEPTQTAVRIDGIDVPWLFHWYVLRSVANPAVVDSVSLRPSGLPASEGGFAQGLVQVELEDRVEERGVYGRVTADVLDGSVALKGRAGRWNLSASGRTSWLGELASIPGAIAAASQGDTVPYTAIRWSDYHARVVADLGRHELTITALGAVDVMRTYGDVSQVEGGADLDALPYDTRHPIARNFHRFSVRWTSTTPRFEQSTTWTVGYDRDASLFDLFFRPAGVELTHVEGPTFGALQSWRGWMRHRERWKLSPKWALGVGVDVDAQLADAEDWANLDPKTSAPEADRQHLLTASPWIMTEYTTASTWLSIGARVAAHWLSRPDADVAIEPRVVFRQRLTDVVTLTGSASGTSQRPPAWRTSTSLGSASVGVERSWQATVGVESRWRDGVAFDVTAYGSWLPSVVLSRVALVRGSRDPADPMTEVWSDLVYERASGAAAGVEAGVRWTPSSAGLLGVSLTAAHAWRYDGTESWASDHDRPFAATVWGAWRPGRQWTLSARARVAAGVPAAAPTTMSDLYRDALVVAGEPHKTEREPWSHQIDLRVAKTFVARRARFTLYLDVFNATDQRIPLATRYDVYLGQVVPFLYLPVIPSLGLDVVF